MSNRRAPLANVPNAVNSPHRGGLLATKRPRPLNSQADGSVAHPPLKKQILYRGDGGARSPPRKLACQTTDSKLFTRKNNAQPTAFERKLAAAREKQNVQVMSKPKKNTAETAESIRQWQRHYQKAFPSFVFYFDSVQDDIRQRWGRQVCALGASDEVFFSKDVTHVVTTRPIPPELQSQSFETTTATEEHKGCGETNTVNPSLLDNSTETTQSRRPRQPYDKRPLDGGLDILHRARQLNIKIWSLDKLERFIIAILDRDLPQHGHFLRNNVAAVNRSKAEPDLSTVLRNEKLNGPSDRSSLLGARDLVPFKGPYIYVYDYHGQTRPVLVRDYPKVARKQDGVWPQFRSASLGKCPFLEDSKETVQAKKIQQEKQLKLAVKGKPVLTTTVKEMAPPPSFEKPALKPSQIDHRRKVTENVESARPAVGQAGLPLIKFKAGTGPVPSLGACSLGEIAASGIQPSNITSAIRSQMISSTAPVSGAKAGTSREIHELKRKVLEKNNGILLNQNPSNSTTAVGTRVPTTRASKAKALENLGMIPEDRKVQSISKANVRQTTAPKRDPKPGYCENCREKFDEFDEHIKSRQHRRFAANPSNWSELDRVLGALQRDKIPARIDPESNWDIDDPRHYGYY
ncbi:hypothetical protein UREG_01134 [Uncinocarpus reesii 1704]|uniref:DBF4-type domain-containing protein n=1 Tax=Uncinocarpus reesii (strain UAMH 1704) TaxID=336963 RepID=C4JGE3_UNCRE|nr:uncharacterized protein UREG_01134 [Uncinocarpus reesii 1704]EEP76285.1 hypothetical protein UREG_01134 [Uncinocarpus reesii 1704]